MATTEIPLLFNKAESISSLNSNDLSKRAAIVQVTLSFLASLSAISPGIALGFPAITTIQLLSRDDGDIVLTTSQISWFASITSIASPVGGLLSGFVTEKLGRRNTLFLINIMSLISWLIIGFSSRANVQLCFIELMIGRALTGFAGGMIGTPTVMYCSEICHPKIRGRMTVLAGPFFICFGSLIAYFLGYLIPNDFRLVSIIAAGITVAAFILLFFIPESPVHLVTKNKVDKARRSLTMIRNLDKNDLKIDFEIQEIEDSRNITGEEQSIFAHFMEFGKPELYRPFFIMISFFAVHQFSGILVILVYAALFSIEAGVVMDAFLSTVIIGVIICLATLSLLFTSDKFGRKPMTITSGIGMLLSMLGITLCSVFHINQGNFSWLPAAFLYCFIFSGSIGFLPIPYAMVAEMYSQKSRGFATGITLCISFLMSFIHIKIFPSIFEYFGKVVIFSFYTFVSLVGALFAIFILPETKGKTLQEIEQFFKNK